MLATCPVLERWVRLSTLADEVPIPGVIWRYLLGFGYRLSRDNGYPKKKPAEAGFYG